MDDDCEKFILENSHGSYLEETDVKFNVCSKFKKEPDNELENAENLSEISEEKKFSQEIFHENSICSNHNPETKPILPEKVEFTVKKKKCRGSINLTCYECNYNTKRSDHMKLHLVKHSDYRPFKCPLCSHRSKRQDSLQEHIKTHTDEKPFSCHLCDYRARKKCALEEHMRKHSEKKERPYICLICGHRSLRSSHLKLHMKLHVDYRPFQCNLCDYSAKRSGHLNSHMKIHFGKDLNDIRKKKKKRVIYREYMCNICHFKTDNRYVIRTHIKFMHS